MRGDRVEFRDLARHENVLVVSQHESERSSEHIHPSVAFVGAKLGLSRAEHMFEHLNLAGMPGNRHDYTTAIMSIGLQMHTLITCSRCRDEPNKRHPEHSRDRDQQVETGLPPTGFEPRQGAH